MNQVTVLRTSAWCKFPRFRINHKDKHKIKQTTSIKYIHTTFDAAAPPSGAFGLALCLRTALWPSSLFAGHVGNIDGSTGNGDSYWKRRGRLSKIPRRHSQSSKAGNIRHLHRTITGMRELAIS